MMILKEKIEKTAKENCRFRREEKLGQDRNYKGYYLAEKCQF